MNSKKRDTWSDFIRIIAILFVIYNHTEMRGFYLYLTNTGSVTSIIYFLMSSICKAGVPLFFMISGYYLEQIGNLRKKIFKTIILIVVFSCAYYIYDLIFNINVTESLIQDNIFKSIIGKSYWHLWYLYRYVVFLLLVPIYRVFFNALKFTNVMYIFILIVFYQTIYLYIDKYVIRLNSQLLVPLFIDPVFVYPFIGYAVKKFDKISSNVTLFYTFIIIVCGFIINIVLFNFYRNEIIQGDEFFINNVSIFVSIFIFITCRMYAKYLTFSLIAKIAPFVLYIYLLHIFILWKIKILNNIYNKIIEYPLFNFYFFTSPPPHTYTRY